MVVKFHWSSYVNNRIEQCEMDIYVHNTWSKTIIGSPVMCSVSGNNKRFNELNCSEVVNTYNNYTFYNYQYEHNYGNYSS